MEGLGRGVDGVKIMKIERLAFYGVATFFILLLLAMIVPVNIGGGPAKIPRAKMEEVQLSQGLNNYEITFGAYPSRENSNIVKVLAGDNPQKTVFLNFRRTSEYPNEMVDPWGTPYAINFSSTNSFVISSAGKDKVFGDADDIIFNSVSNNFVKP